jgi:DNA repair protein RadC
MTYDWVSERTHPPLKITCPADLIPALQQYSTKKQEHFLVITLDGSQQVIRIHIVCIGLLNRTLTHPREVYVRAIKDHAASSILAHNHPSGAVVPSKEDREATRRLCECGKLLGIEVLDHLIFSKGAYYSFNESGTMPPSAPIVS